MEYTALSRLEVLKFSWKIQNVTILYKTYGKITLCRCEINGRNNINFYEGMTIDELLQFLQFLQNSDFYFPFIYLLLLEFNFARQCLVTKILIYSRASVIRTKWQTKGFADKGISMLIQYLLSRCSSSCIYLKQNINVNNSNANNETKYNSIQDLCYAKLPSFPTSYHLNSIFKVSNTSKP